MYIFRENTEDIYAGIEWRQGTPEAKVIEVLTEEMGVKKIRFPETSSFGIKPVSVEGTERLVRAAIEYAILHQLPSVTLVHKGNIMKFTEGGFKLWGYALAEREFADLTFTWPQAIGRSERARRGSGQYRLSGSFKAGKIIIKDVIAVLSAKHSINSGRIFRDRYLEPERRLYLRSISGDGRWHWQCSRR